MYTVDLSPKDSLNLLVSWSGCDNERLTNRMDIQPPSNRSRSHKTLSDGVARMHRRLSVITYTRDDLSLLTPELDTTPLPRPPHWVTSVAAGLPVEGLEKCSLTQ